MMAQNLKWLRKTKPASADLAGRIWERLLFLIHPHTIFTYEGGRAPALNMGKS
jgi:hypothetical protein